MGQTPSIVSEKPHEATPTGPPSKHVGPNGRYRLDKWLSEGQFGRVRLAFDTVKQKHVAIKFIGRGPKLDVENVTKEIMNHRTLEHPHVIRFKQVFLTDKALCIVMEYAPGGDMHTFITGHGCLAESWAKWFFQQIIIAIEYCHKREVVLRDIKLENLLLDKRQQLLKVCDFGFSKHHQHDSEPHTCVGTPFYLAPEVLKSAKRTPYDGEKVDIWTCGVCLYVMLYGTYPFSDPNDAGGDYMGYYQRMLRGQVNFPTEQPRDDSAPLSKGCLDLLRRMLETSASKRITLDEIKLHPWFLEDLPEGSLVCNDDAGAVDENEIVVMRRLQSASEIERLVSEAAQGFS